VYKSRVPTHITPLGHTAPTTRQARFLFAIPPLIPRASPRQLPHAHVMDDLTDDEVLADAIGYMAFFVLGGLAGDAEARQAFLEGFLRLVGATGWVYPARSATGMGGTTASGA
jgi:hypothetical protein